MSTMDIVETWKREAEAEGFARAAEKFLIGVYEARFGGMPSDLEDAIRAKRDETVLFEWAKLAATLSAEDFSAKVRAGRSS